MNMDISGLTPERQRKLLEHCNRLKREQRGQEVLQQAGVDHLDPTFDKTFKWLMGPNNSDIARTIFDSMVFLTYRGLVTRSVDTVGYNSQQLDAMTEQLKKLPNDLCEFQALSPDVTATLQLLKLSRSKANSSGVDDKNSDVGTIVDECIEILESGDEIDKDTLTNKLRELKTQIDNFKSDIGVAADIVNRIGRLMIDIEMQRSKQGIIEARALQYGAIMLLSRHAPNLLPLVLISICQWENVSDDTVNDVFHAGIGKNSKNPISISQTTINILKVGGAISMDDSERKRERKRVKDTFKTSLRKRYPELTKSVGSFKDLWFPQEGDDEATQIAKLNLRTAYEVLCFLRLAPLTPQLGDGGADKDSNPDKIGLLDEKVLQTRIFNPTIREAYDLMKTNNVDTPGAQEQYLGVWSEQARIDEMKQEVDAQQQNTNKMKQFAVNALVVSALATKESALEFAETVSDEQQKAKIVTNTMGRWANKTFSNQENLGIRKAIIEQIRNKQDDFGEDVVKILKDEYDQAVASGAPATPSRIGDFELAERTPLAADSRGFTTPPRTERSQSGGYPSPITPQGTRLPESALESTRKTRFSVPPTKPPSKGSKHISNSNKAKKLQ
jgi:hypothetical protein